MTDAELKNVTLAGAIKIIGQKTISPIELTQAAMHRVEQLNPEMRALITVVENQAGVPVSVKDLYDTQGIRTTAGAKVFADRIPAEDATVVKKIKAAACAIIGKANLHEFAFGATTINPHYGTARNPWDRDRICGGSSGGSASAVALGLGLASVGSDTGGSIRIPASLCGVVGLKPTYGRVSVKGVIPLSWSMDHAGPITKTVEDAAILLGIIAGYDRQDPYCRNVEVPQYVNALTGNIKDIRLGIPNKHFYENLAPDVSSAVLIALRSFERLGAKTVDIELPGVEIHRGVWLQIASPEAYSFHEPLLKKHAGFYGRDVRSRLEAGRTLLSIDYVRAQRTRTIIRQDCKKIFDRADVIVTPTVPIAAPRIDDVHKPWGQTSETAIAALTRFTRYFNVTGLPAISIPCGFTKEGLPIGIQIVGRAFDEETVLRVAHAYEQDAKWFEWQPAM